MIKLHVGGTEPKEGWSILNIQPGPGVDYVGSCTDLSFLGEGSCAEIYASHVLEHVGYETDIPRSLAEMHRVLAPGGRLRLSVPDFQVLCRMFLSGSLSFRDRYEIMRIVFGGQTDAHDFHAAGLWPELLNALLREAGFTRIAPAEVFREFKDASGTVFAGQLVSYNVEAFK